MPVRTQMLQRMGVVASSVRLGGCIIVRGGAKRAGAPKSHALKRFEACCRFDGAGCGFNVSQKVGGCPP